MRLLNTDTLDEAIEKLNKACEKSEMKTETVELEDSFGRIIAVDICAKENVPMFDRSVVDGYAVRSNDTGGASESLPTFLRCVGEVLMGEGCDISLKTGECCYIPTGAMLPEGADSVVMVEYTEKFTDDEIAVYQATSPKRGITEKGDDVKAGEVVLTQGTRLGSAEMGLLASCGIEKVEVYEKRKVSIISTGDELVKPGESLEVGQVRDINTYALIGAAKELGFEVVNSVFLKDDRELLKNTVLSEMGKADIVAVSGGSSQGKKDVTESVIDEVCSSKVITHGISIKPGKPTITGYDEATDTIVIGLPGHPQAALIIFKEFFSKRKKGILARMYSNVPSAPGRTTIQFVTLEKTENEMIAKPIFSKSGMINAVVKADGYILTDMNEEGINKGDIAEVFLLK